MATDKLPLYRLILVLILFLWHEKFWYVSIKQTFLKEPSGWQVFPFEKLLFFFLCLCLGTVVAILLTVRSFVFFLICFI